MLFYVKNTTFPNPLDLLAPHTCRGCGRLGSPLCNECKNYIIAHHQNLCPICKQPKSTLLCPACPKAPAIFTINTRDSLIGTLLHDLKYQSIRALASPIADILDQTFPPLSGKVIIVPLPTIAKHVRARGLDHTYLIAKHFARLRGKNYQVQKLLLRNQDTVQVGASRSDRLAQASSAYTINPRVHLDPAATYILLDDVWTTGASLGSAYQKIFPELNDPEKIVLCALSLSVFDN